MQALTITRPDDWHVHLRDGTALETTVPHCATRFGRAIVMPNLATPVTTTALALTYRERILAKIPSGMNFDPLMTLYLTDNTAVDEIQAAKDSGHIYAVKYYPAGATTNSDHGVTDIAKCYAVLEAMQTLGMPLLVHGEVTDPEVDIFDREKIFIDQQLMPLTERFPELRIVFEHITTSDAVAFVSSASSYVAATITVHHLMLNRNAMLAGGMRPHHYCLPVLKRETHRQALITAATSADAKYFLGTDSAPHDLNRKETACGCAGIYSAHAAIELYAEIFEQAGALDRLEAFASFHGADFYHLPRNSEKITLTKKAWTVPDHYSFAEGSVVPLRASQQVEWCLS